MIIIFKYSSIVFMTLLFILLVYMQYNMHKCYLTLRTEWSSLCAEQTEVGWTVWSVDVLTGRTHKTIGLTDVNREMTESLIFWLVSWCQAPDPDLDLFGSISAPSAIFPTTHTPAQTSHTPAVSQGLQDLSMLDFGGGKRYSSALKQPLKPA